MLDGGSNLTGKSAGVAVAQLVYDLAFVGLRVSQIYKQINM